MIRYYHKERGHILKELEEITPSCWINIAPPFTQEELEDLSSQLNVPIEFFTDSLDVDERSRYEIEDSSKLIVISTPITNEVEPGQQEASVYITVPIGIITTPGHVVTISSFENPVLNRFLDDRIRSFDTIDHAQFVLSIFEQNVYQFLYCLKDINRRRNNLEKELYESNNSDQLRQLLSLDKSLVYFITTLNANELLMLKMKRIDFLHIGHDEDKSDLIEAIIIDIGQAHAMANTYSAILNSTMNAYTSIVSTKLNEVMKTLTLITVVLQVPTLVSSIFGMNLDNHFEQSQYAFYVIVLLSLGIALLVAYIFRRLF
jgi:magnesium transporter